ncbi:MAG: histidinol dehydrogenase [Dysgonamonadaceae bacterium]|jgi:histidinol dehydrogenase|nr:histidinol dehydrogenase [Dysgonamonadaceae bacterium]
MMGNDMGTGIGGIIRTVVNPGRETWEALTSRPVFDVSELFGTARRVLDDVRREGDTAVRRYGLEFDSVDLPSVEVSEAEKEEAFSAVPEVLRSAIGTALRNIEKFHSAQRILPPEVETFPGVRCWQRRTPVEKVGLYVPGGTAPLLSTVLMLAVPARVAGCREVVLCSPPGPDGRLHPAVTFAATLSGVERIFKVGGIQAIGAMAYGTETIPRVYKIFGPGNRYVTAAKQLVGIDSVAIDMPAGPSEVEIIADDAADPVFVAADILSQAEHGIDSQAILVSTSRNVIDLTLREVARQLPLLERRLTARGALSNSLAVVFDNYDDVVSFTDFYAPEHLIIQTRNYGELSDRVSNAGSVFLGPYTPESAGDYASGTNHTLPTNGHARAYSGLSLESFTKRITFQEITREGINGLGPTILAMAEGERLSAHGRAVSVRMGR